MPIELPLKMVAITEAIAMVKVKVLIFPLQARESKQMQNSQNKLEQASNPSSQNFIQTDVMYMI